MRRTIGILSILVLLSAVWVGWAAWGVRDIGEGLRSRDPARIREVVDVRSVRRSVISQVLDASAGEIEGAGRFSGIARTLAIGAATAAIDRRAEALLTDDVLVRLLVEGRVPDDLGTTPASGGASATEPLPVDDRPYALAEDPLRNLMGLGLVSPRSFRIVVGEDGALKEWTGIVVRLSGGRWRIRDVELSEAVLDRIAPVLRARLEASV